MSRVVWFVTGTSSGIGLSLVKELLKQNYKVAATSRSLSRLVEAVGSNKTDHFLPLEVQLTNEESVKKAVDETVAHFGTIDVCVNNAGHGLRGTVEETTGDEARQLFEDNFFSAHTVLRYVLPIMRNKRNGYIFNIGSIAAVIPQPLSPFYAASKAALTAMTESLAAEVAHLGIKAVPVQPGPFKTLFHDPRNLVGLENRIPDYKASHADRAEREKRIHHTGDPDRAARTIIEVANMEDVPKVLFLGAPCIPMVSPKVQLMHDEIEKWKPLTVKCDFPSE